MAGSTSIASARFSRQMRAVREDGAAGPWYIRAPGVEQCNPLQPRHQALRRRIPHVVTGELDHVWQQIQGALLERVGERTYGLWLAPLRCVSLDGDTLVLEGPPEVSAWASTRLADALAERRRRRARSRQWRSRSPAAAPTPRRADARRPRRARRVARNAEPQVHLRAVRHRPVQPPRPRRGAVGRRDALAGLQPALHLRTAGPRQDAPAPRRRQLRRRLRRRPDGALRHRRGVHERLPRRPRAARPRRLQGRASAAWTCC